jgi:NAD(P)-dependent dehydrogenase (short-subunit alcohol dehydrogenase family)
VRRGLHPGDHWAFAADYSALPSIGALLAELGRRWDSLDALVNCAGVFGGAPAIDSALAEWRIPFDTMINGAIFLTRGCAPLMKAGGRIIHVTSIHGERAQVRASAYSMAKAALNQYCRALALELAPAGILVNAIAPGFIDTPMSVVDGVSELDTPWFRANYIEGHHLPLKRAGKPDEIAGVAYFLAGPDASYLTGQVITVDGGLTITF